MTKVLKSSYTMKVVAGDDYEWEIEVFFFNNKSKLIEPVSPAPHSTPKHLKKSFGFIQSVVEVDSDILKIVNSSGEEINLAFDKMSPLIDDTDSTMKKTLLKVKSSGCATTVNTLNKLIAAFHEPENIIIIPSSLSISEKPRERMCSNALKKVPTDSGVAFSSSASGNVETHSVRLTRSRDRYRSSDERRRKGRQNSSEEKREGRRYSSRKSSQHSTVEKRKGSLHSLGEKRKGRQPSLREKRKGSQHSSVKKRKGSQNILIEKRKGSQHSSEKKGKGSSEKRKGNHSSEERPSKKSNLDSEEEDIFTNIEQIIKDSVYINVKFQNIEIPKLVKIDASKVAQLKESVKRFPDRTQTFVGLIRVVDEEGNQVGPYQCWVNAELYVALFELEMEADGEDHGCVLSIVHEVAEDGEVQSEVVGSFLMNNSKEFAAILHDSLYYQDLLRFACTTLSTEMSEKSKTFLKRTLRGFTKGNKNANFFIKFASLPVEYLNKFERFCRLFEEGSLNGMKVSHRKRISLDKESNKKQCCKLEIPLQFLKLHLKVNHETREQMLDQLLKKAIGFNKYKEELIKASEILEVRKQVSRICGKDFVEVKEKYPELVSDEALSEFCGASGQNNQYLKLARHIEEGMSHETQKEGKSSQAAKVDFKNASKMALTDTIRIVTAHDVVVAMKGKDHVLNDKMEFAFKEHIRGNAAIGVYIDSSIKSVKSGLEHLDENDTEFVVEPVYVKKAAPEIDGGFRRDNFPVFVVGHSKLFKNKEIPTFLPYQLKDALPLLLHQLTAIGSKVLFAFEEDCHAFDVDPQGVLGRKDVTICYLSGEEALEKVADKIGRKKC